MWEQAKIGEGEPNRIAARQIIVRNKVLLAKRQSRHTSRACISTTNQEDIMEYIKVFDASQLPVGQMKKAKVKGKEILVGNVEGSIYAMANKCSHLGGSLERGSLDGSVVTCRNHGAQFDLRDGGAVGKAKIAVLKMGVKDLESYSVKVEDGEIWVGIPD